MYKQPLNRTANDWHIVNIIGRVNWANWTTSNNRIKRCAIQLIDVKVVIGFQPPPCLAYQAHPSNSFMLSPFLTPLPSSAPRYIPRYRFHPHNPLTSQRPHHWTITCSNLVALSVNSNVSVTTKFLIRCNLVVLGSRFIVTYHSV